MIHPAEFQGSLLPPKKQLGLATLRAILLYMVRDFFDILETNDVPALPINDDYMV